MPVVYCKMKHKFTIGRRQKPEFRKVFRVPPTGMIGGSEPDVDHFSANFLATLRRNSRIRGVNWRIPARICVKCRNSRNSRQMPKFVKFSTTQSKSTELHAEFFILKISYLINSSISIPMKRQLVRVTNTHPELGRQVARFRSRSENLSRGGWISPPKLISKAAASGSKYSNLQKKTLVFNPLI